LSAYRIEVAVARLARLTKTCGLRILCAYASQVVVGGTIRANVVVEGDAVDAVEEEDIEGAREGVWDVGAVVIRGKASSAGVANKGAVPSVEHGEGRSRVNEEFSVSADLVGAAEDEAVVAREASGRHDVTQAEPGATVVSDDERVASSIRGSDVGRDGVE